MLDLGLLTIKKIFAAELFTSCIRRLAQTTAFFAPCSSSVGWCCYREAEGLIFHRCGFSSFFSSFSLFRCLISEVTERISTKLRHIFTYDCYLKNVVRTPRGIYPHWLGTKTKLLFWDWIWTLTEHISATEHDINNRKKNCQSTCPQIWWTLVQKRLRTVGEFLPTPLNFRIERHCQPYRMDVI